MDARENNMKADTICNLRIDRVAWASIVALLTGCASPYVATDRSVVTQQLKPQVLGDAIRQARARSLDYRDKVVELGESERLLSNGLLTLGAAIVGASVAKVHSSAITGGALLAGSAYTIGTFNTDKRRGAIYLAGIKAIDCSVAAVIPLALSDEAQKELDKQKKGLDKEVPNLAKAAGSVDQWVVQARGSRNALYFKAAIESGQAGLAAAAATTTKANGASAAAANRVLRAEEMGSLLVGTVKDIDAAVLLEIRGTEGSLQAVPGLVATIQTNAGLFAPAAGGDTEPVPRGGGQPDPAAPKPALPTDDDLRVMKELGEAIGALRQATMDVDSRAERLSSLATPVNSQSAEALKLCKVEATLKPMTVTPPAVTFTAKKTGTQTVQIAGGNGNYAGAFLHGSAPGLKAVTNPLFPGAIDVVADDKTVAGDYQLMVQDSTRQSRVIVTVTVAAATAAGEAAGQSDKVQKAIAAIVAAKTVVVNGTTVTLENARARGQNGVAVDYRAQGGAAVSPQDVAIEVGNLPGVGNVLGMGSNTVEAVNLDAQPLGGLQFPDGASLPRDQVRKLQTALCLPEPQRDGLWGLKTQAALERDRARRRVAGAPNVAAVGAQLSAAERKTLLARSAEAVAATCKP
jgi:hypothetical protein